MFQYKPYKLKEFTIMDLEVMANSVHRPVMITMACLSHFGFVNFFFFFNIFLKSSFPYTFILSSIGRYRGKGWGVGEGEAGCC